jgi:MoxR-like ATPase
MVERVLIGLLQRATCCSRACRASPRRSPCNTSRDASRPQFSRIQFTPDLLPADLVGTVIYNQQTASSPPRRAPSSPTSSWPTRSTARPPRCRARCSRPCRSGRSPSATDLPAARAVPGAGHAEPHRAGGHLPAARGAGRPLHAQGEGRLPDARGGEGDPGPHDGRPNARRQPGHHPEQLMPGARGHPQIYVDDKVKDYILDIVFATREPREARPERPHRRLIQYGAARAPPSRSTAPRARTPSCATAATSRPRTSRPSGPTCCATASSLTYEAEAEELTAERIVQRVFERVEVP